MDKNIRDSLLLDFYGNMLTQKQKEIMRLYNECDSGLSEIAEELGMSRQAVYDVVKVSQSALENFEIKLKCVEKYIENRETILNCISELQKEKQTEKTQKIIKNLEKVLMNQ